MPIRISGSTGISGLDGSATTPVLQGASANSGIYYSGNTVFVATSSTTALTIGPTGNATFSNTATFSSNVTFTSNNVTIGGNAISPFGGMRNIFINGAMAIAQRGTTSSSTGYQTVDRWNMPNGTNQAQLTDAPTGFSNSLEVTGTVAGSSGYGIIYQNIESKNIIPFIGQSCVISAYIKNTGTSSSTFNCELYYANATDNFSGITYISSPTPQSITTGWTRVTFPAFVVPSSAASGLQVRLFRYDGSNSQKWQITGIQMEAGTVATPFEFRQYTTELALCHRYYWQGYGIIAAGNYFMYNISYSNWVGNFGRFPVTMRATPTMSFTGGSGVNCSSVGVYLEGPDTFTHRTTGGGGGQVGNYAGATYKADAEL